MAPFVLPVIILDSPPPINPNSDRSIRLVTPPNGVVLDPFLGSGTTAMAAKMEGFNWLGIEREAEYVKIAEARIKAVQVQRRLV